MKDYKKHRIAQLKRELFKKTSPVSWKPRQVLQKQVWSAIGELNFQHFETWDFKGTWLVALVCFFLFLSPSTNLLLGFLCFWANHVFLGFVEIWWNRRLSDKHSTPVSFWNVLIAVWKHVIMKSLQVNQFCALQKRLLLRLEVWQAVNSFRRASTEKKVCTWKKSKS